MGQQAKAKNGKATAYYLFDKKKRQRTDAVTCDPSKSVKAKPVSRRRSRRTDLLLSTAKKHTVRFKGKLPEGFKAFSVPSKHRRRSPAPRPRSFCPQSNVQGQSGAQPTVPGVTNYYLFKNYKTPEQSGFVQAVPADDG